MTHQQFLFDKQRQTMRDWSVAEKLHRYDHQQQLFETEQLSEGTRRTHAGDFFEEATARITGKSRLRTSSDCDIAPDIRWDAKTLFEVKSVGRGKTVAIFEQRLQKDRDFMEASGEQLVYWFWHHTTKTKEAETPQGLRKLLVANFQELWVVSAATIHAALLALPVKKTRTRGKSNGWGSEKYAEYRNLHLRMFTDCCCHVSTSQVAVYEQVFAVTAKYDQQTFQKFFVGANGEAT